MRASFITAAVTAFGLCAGAASASTITVTGITGTWIDVVPASAVTISNSVDNGTSTSSLRWGEAATANGKSGYDFTIVDPGSLDISEEQRQFEIADFTHLNFPVYPPSLESARLEILISLDVDGQATTLSNTFSFTHNETTNDAAQCPGQATPCDDLVTVSGDNMFGGQLMIDGVEYFLQVEGFKATANGPILNFFQTTEGQKNTAGLWVSFKTEQELQASVPLPAGAWLMVSGIGALAVARKRRKAA